MKLQTSQFQFDTIATVTSIAQCSSKNHSDIIIACNDKTLRLYNIESKRIEEEPMKMNHPPTALAWQPIKLTNPHQRSTDGSAILAIGDSNGFLHFYKMNQSAGKHWPLVPIQTNDSKSSSVGAHKKGAAVSTLRWSYDGSSVATASVDGEVRIWSRRGHLRTKLATFRTAVRCISWGPSSESLVVAHGRSLSILHLQNSSTRNKSVSWDAQETGSCGVVLAVDWNRRRDLIASGGEDGCFRIFTPDGVPVYSSHCDNVLSHPITSVSWVPEGGDYVAVGSFRQLSLHGVCGSIHDQIEYNGAGSIIDISNPINHSSQLLAGCSDGGIIVSHLVGQRAFWNGRTAEAITTNKLGFTYSTKSDKLPDEIEIPGGPIVDFAMGFEYLIIITSSQCLIYSMNVLDPPIIVEPKDDYIYDITLGPTNFAIVGRNGIKIYSYQGKYISSPNYQLTMVERTAKSSITIGRDILALIDDSDKKVVRLFSCETGQSLDNIVGQVRHESDVVSVHLSHTNNHGKDHLVIIDRKKDLHIRLIGRDYDQDSNDISYKLETQVESASWDETSSMLCSLTDSKLVLFYFPSAPFIDVDLLEETKESIELEISKEETKESDILSFYSDQCTIILRNETVVHIPVSKSYSLLYEYISMGNWKECLRLCQFGNVSTMWATLACSALYFDELEIAETSLVAIKAIDKFEHLRAIRKMPQGERKNAELCLYKRNTKEALSILLQARPPLLYDAVEICIRLFQWEQALVIATKETKTKSSSHSDEGDIQGGDLVELVLCYRSRYLQSLSRKEEIDAFKELYIVRGVISLDRLENLKRELKTRFNALQ